MIIRVTGVVVSETGNRKAVEICGEPKGGLRMNGWLNFIENLLE